MIVKVNEILKAVKLCKFNGVLYIALFYPVCPCKRKKTYLVGFVKATQQCQQRFYIYPIRVRQNDKLHWSPPPFAKILSQKYSLQKRIKHDKNMHALRTCTMHAIYMRCLVCTITSVVCSLQAKCIRLYCVELYTQKNVKYVCKI